jgi:hypothetical protein
MHFRFLVTFDKEQAENSQAARSHVSACLLNNGFVYTDIRWSGGYADWFVVGGRWSGELSRHSWAKSLAEKMHEVERKNDVMVWGAFYGNEAKQKTQRKLAKKFQQMWDSDAPEAYVGIPIQRDTYALDGYEDDAMLLTKELYDNLLKEYEGTVDSEYHADLDCDEISPDMIGKKWIVVVDYHT